MTVFRRFSTFYETIKYTLFVIPLLFVPTGVTAASNNIQLLYFFSATCPHCKQTNPVVTELSKDYPVQALLYGKEDPGPMGFPIRKGTREERDKYGVAGVPVLVVLMQDKPRTVLSGEKSIIDAPLVLKALKKGARTVSEASADARPEKDSLIIGWVKSRGAYFDEKTKFFLTDRRNNIMVNPWLPLEAVKSKFKKARPRLMSDVLGKPVLLRGKLVKTDSELRFEVREEVSFE